MAYSSWGGFVYLNGMREHIMEDCNFQAQTDLPCSEWHVLMGTGEIRLAGFKCQPYLFVNEEQKDLVPYKLGTSNDYGEVAWYGKIRQCFFGIVRYPMGQRMEMFLVEKDGNIWNSTMGYCIGAGWEDNLNAREEVVRPRYAAEIKDYLKSKYPQGIKKYGSPDLR